MPLTALLLRLLLCASLLASVIGPARNAHGADASSQAFAAAQTAAPEAPAGGDCHDDPAATAPADAPAGDVDCCDSEACECGCTLATASLPARAPRVTNTWLGASPHALTATPHPPPRLMHLMRPPIG